MQLWILGFDRRSDRHTIWMLSCRMSTWAANFEVA
jgi:hypothetical protein